MMDWNDFKKAASDRFTPSELVELLDVSTEEVIEALCDYGSECFTEDAIKDLEEIMGVGDDTFDN